MHTFSRLLVESSEVVWGNNRDSVKEAKKRTAHDKLQPKTNRLCIVHVHVYVHMSMCVCVLDIRVLSNSTIEVLSSGQLLRMEHGGVRAHLTRI